MMNLCPISYEPTGQSLYNEKGLNILSQNLTHLELLEYTATEQREEAMSRASKLSIQGVQPKLSTILNIKEGKFELVDNGGKYILKPQHHIYPHIAENEDVTMRMAKSAGINVPLHGMIWSKDNTLTYFIKRFDRAGHNNRIPVEDFAQLAGLSRETKYNYSMEKLVKLIDKYCTFPMIEKARLFKLVLFDFLTGNEDMHLKNFSLLRNADKIELSPAYDLLNTTILLKGEVEEIALPIAGKKKKLNRKILVDYFGKDCCGLTGKVIERTLMDLSTSKPFFYSLLEKCFLSEKLQEKYSSLLEIRLKVLEV
ncbi:HipA domain-containing protein [Bacteroidota bacterium]